MSHPDEGLIHAWLDGELDAAEAARVDALVTADPAWAAAAAEARGFIAASSRIVGMLDHVPAGVVPGKPSEAGPSGSGSAHVTPRREAPSRGTPWWAMRVAALLVVATGTVFVVQRLTPDDATGLGDRVANQAATPAAPAASAPAAAPPAARLEQTTAPRGAAAATQVKEKSASEELKDARGAAAAPVAVNEADAARRSAQLTVPAGQSGAQPSQVSPRGTQQVVPTAQQIAPDLRQLTQTAQPSRRDQPEVGKVQGADEKRLASADSAAAAQKATVRGAASGAAASASKADQARPQPVNAVSREECYREPPATPGGPVIVHRVGRTSDSTALASAVLGLRAQADAFRAREAERDPARMRVHGDTLLIGVVNGVPRVAIRVSCPAP